MSTEAIPTPTPAGAQPPPTAVTAPPDAAARITARTDQLVREMSAAQTNKPLAQRLSEKALRKQARKQAAREVRVDILATKAKRTASGAAGALSADLRSAVHRNRRQLAPWALAAPYALTGEGVHLLANYGSGMPIGISALCAAGAATASVVTWRRRLARRTPARFAPKVRAGLGLLCGWTAAMPLVPSDGQAGMWLSLVAGTAWMSLSWWRETAYPIPLPADLVDLDIEEHDVPEPDGDSSDPTLDRAFAEQVITDWATYVAGRGTLPHSYLDTPVATEHGWSWQLHLVRGKQKISDVRAAKHTIGPALDIAPGKISIDPGPDLSTVLLTVVTREVDATYDGPRIIREGGDVFIEVGPYEDGIGSERFHVLGGQLTEAQLEAGERPRGSVNGGFILGTKGSGKSRLMEAIAVGLRALGIELWYLDPQSGKSSPALMAEADWPLSGVHGSKGAYSNIVDLWAAVKAVNELRSAEGGAAGHQGFQHTRERPAIMVMIDECHGVFESENPETGNSFGEDFANLDREMRKNGIGLIGASQAITQDTFGRGNKAAVLRDGMCAVNTFVMAYGGHNLGLAPGYDGQPAKLLPTHHGYGFNLKGERPHTRWQARYTPDFQPWLRRYPSATLDERARKRIGVTYQQRFEQHAADQAAAQAWLNALDAHVGDASTLPAFGQGGTQQAGTPGQSAMVLALLSPHQQRLRAAAGLSDTGEHDPQPAPQANETNADLTEAEQRVLDVLREASQSPTTLASQLQVSPQAAGKHLRNITAKGRAVKMEDGRYMAKS